MSNLERDFRQQVIRSLDPGMCLVDIPDELKRALQAFPQYADKMKGFITKKPYDLGILYQGRYQALELKKINDGFSIKPSSVMEPHQYPGLLAVAEAGGQAGLLVQFKFALTDKQMQKLQHPHRVLDLTVYLDSAIIDLDKSYRIQELQETAVVIPKIKDRLDLKVLWNQNDT